MQNGSPAITIIGGGFTGAAIMIALLDRIVEPFRLTCIEPEAQIGRGLAYGKAEPYHLLNVRAVNLTIRADKPGDFADWAAARYPDQQALSGQFLPRRAFGDYVEQRLAEALRLRRDVDFRHVRAEATRIDRVGGSYRIGLLDRRALRCDVAVLALGYGRPDRRGRFGASAFAQLDWERVATAKTALFVGTGLTFVDEWIRLRRNGFRGRAHAVSRRGLLPERHSGVVSQEASTLVPPNACVRQSVQDFRRALARMDQDGPSPGDVVAGLRDSVQALWLSLDVGQQRQFLRHLRPYWDRLRHRVPPTAHAELTEACVSGSLVIHRCRVEPVEPGSQEPLTVPGKGAELSRPDLIFDCTGHWSAITSPLIRTITRSGLARLDPHGLGIAVVPDGRVLTSAGGISPGLFALGLLGQGSLYEITAVKEIVAQSAAAASRIFDCRVWRRSLHRAVG